MRAIPRSCKYFGGKSVDQLSTLFLRSGKPVKCKASLGGVGDVVNEFTEKVGRVAQIFSRINIPQKVFSCLGKNPQRCQGPFSESDEILP